MNANAGALPGDAASVGRAGERLISVPYLLLRASTAGGALAMGFVQTFAFARALSPERFSIFIVVGALGYTLWVTDLGLAKIVFVNLRSAHLSGARDERAAREASALILFYSLLAGVAAMLCFAIRLGQPTATLGDAGELGLFFLYVTLNLTWYSLRTIGFSVDRYVFYERLELIRRLFTMAILLTLIAGVPLLAVMLGLNLLWALLIGAVTFKFVRCGALSPNLQGFPGELLSFFRRNSRSVKRSGISALSGVFAANFPYYVVPLIFGLGPAPIILEVTFRVLRGTGAIYTAATDLAIPGQTAALAARDPRRLARTTIFAAGLCCIVAGCVCAILMLAGGPLFAFLLKSAATVPPAITPILIVMVLANVAQIVSESLLQHTGFFRHLAWIGAAVAAMMVVATAISLAANFDIVGFLGAYAAAFTAGAILSVAAAVRGPFRSAAARNRPQPAADLVIASRSAPQSR